MAKSLKDEVKGLSGIVDDLISRISSVSSAMSGPRGRIDTGNNFLNNALGAFSTRPAIRQQAAAGMVAGAVQGGGSAVAAGFAMMPDINATIQRAGVFYNATVRAGQGMSRREVQQATFGALRDGLTAPGSDAMVAGYLTSRGMMASAQFGSTYQQTLRSVSGAAQYLNMENTRAATAIEGLTSGQTSSRMLRQFGVLTSDPTTGRALTQAQIFEQLAGRLTAGRGTATEEETLESLRRGALGNTLRNSGLTGDQQYLFSQYMIEKSRGNNLNLSDPEAMQQLMDKAKAEGNANPFLPGYRLNTSKTGAMQSSEGAYIAGIEAATGALQFLTEAAGNAAGAVGGFRSAAGLFGGDPVGRAAGSLVGGAGSMLGNVAGLALMSRAGLFKGIGGQGGAMLQGLGAGKLGVGATRLMGGVGAVAGGIGTVASIGGAYETAAAGGDSFGNVLGAAGSGALTGASIGMMFGLPGAAIGALIGGTAGLLGGGIAASMGASAAEGGDQGSNNTNGSGAPQQFKLMHPTKSAQITAFFGQRESSFTKGKITWPNGHKGLDYAGKQGDTIFASEGGYATLHDGGQLGKRVRIKHANGMYTHYCHLSAITVKEGEVSKGQPVGAMGNTGGKSTGVHLHFALTTGPDTSSAIDPMPYLQGGGNYLASPPQDAEQAPSSTSPTSSGTTSMATNPGGEDSSPASPTAPSNISPEGTSSSLPVAGGGASGSSMAEGVQSWSSGSVYSSGGGANTAAAPEGGEGASDQPGYLSTPTRAGSSSKPNTTSRLTTNNVTINLTVANASEEEARKFTRMLKRGLEEEKFLNNMMRDSRG